MDPTQLFQRLCGAARDEDNFPFTLEALVAEVQPTDDHLALISVAFRFMEGHRTLDYGTPGALVHYCERFHNRGYEERLIESVSRHPTSQTLGMLIRLINGTEGFEAKARLMALVNDALNHPLADASAKRTANYYRENYEGGDETQTQ